jgi:hypothetical protein
MKRECFPAAPYSCLSEITGKSSKSDDIVIGGYSFSRLAFDSRFQEIAG